MADIETPCTAPTNVTTGLVLDSGGNVGSGSRLKQWNLDSSTKPVTPSHTS